MTKILINSLTALGIIGTAYAVPSMATTTDQQLNDLTQQLQQLEAVINRNQDKAADNPAALLKPTWFQNVVLSGEFEPTFNWSNRNLIYPTVGVQDGSNSLGESSIGRPYIQNQDTTDAYLNTANLYFDAQINNFTDLHTALDYDYNPDKFYSYYAGPNSQELYFSEANVRFSNLAQSGFYTVIGRQYFNFGSYQHDSLNQTFTNLLSEVDGVGATVGYVSNNGFNIDSYILNGDLLHRSDYSRSRYIYVSSPIFQTWGASAGYDWSNETFGVNLQLDFLSNMAQTIYLSHSIAEANFAPSTIPTYYSATPAVFTHSDFNAGPFDLIFDYVTATKCFAASDLAAAYNSNGKPRGAKPQATFTQLEYNFDLLQNDNAVFVAYQTSRNAEAVGSIDMGGYYIPRYRWTIGDDYTLLDNTELDVEYDHDQDYPNNTSNINSGYGYTTESVFVGLDVKF